MILLLKKYSHVWIENYYDEFVNSYHSREYIKLLFYWNIALTIIIDIIYFKTIYWILRIYWIFATHIE